MSALSPFFPHLAVAAAALGFAHSYTLLALEDGEPSRLLLEAAIGDAKTALAYLMHAAAGSKKPVSRQPLPKRHVVNFRLS